MNQRAELIEFYTITGRCEDGRMYVKKGANGAIVWVFMKSLASWMPRNEALTIAAFEVRKQAEVDGSSKIYGITLRDRAGKDVP